MKKLNKRKKILLIIGLIIFLSFFNLVGALFNQNKIPDFGDNYYADELGVLSPKTKDLINQTNRSFKDGQEFFVVTVDNLDEDPVDYGLKIFNEYEIGALGKDNGLLMLLARKRNGKHRIQVITGYGVEGILPDGKVGRIIDDTMMDDFYHDRLDEGVYNGFIAFSDILKNGESSSYYNNRSQEIEENVPDIRIAYGIIGGMFLLTILGIISTAILREKEPKIIKKSKDKWESLSESELREEYAKIPYSHFEVKSYLVNLIFKRMKENTYDLDELIKLYRYEKIPYMDDIYEELILNNTYPITREDAYKYYSLDDETLSFEEFMNALIHISERDKLKLTYVGGDILDAIMERLARSIKDELIIIPKEVLVKRIEDMIPDDILEEINEREPMESCIYKKALALKTRDMPEKELVNLIINTDTIWLRNVYVEELSLRIRDKNLYEIDKILLTLKDRGLIRIYQKEIRRQVGFLDRNARENFHSKSKSRHSKSASSRSSSSSHSSSSRSSGGGSSGGGGAGRNF